MSERRQFISDQYHFLAEMIFISILTLIPLHYYYDWISVWNTLIPAIPLCALFLWLEVKGVKYINYYFIVPFLFVIYLILKFPILISILLSLIIIWRYLRIRQLLIVGRETRYLFMTTIFSLIVYFLTNNLLAIILVFLQLFVFIFGNIYSHIAVMERNKKNWLTFRPILYSVLLLPVGGFIAFWGSNQELIGKAWDYLVYFFFSTIGRVTHVFQFLEKYKGIREGEDKTKLTLTEQAGFEEGGFNLLIIIGLLYFTFKIFLAIMCVIVLFIVIKRDPASHEGIGRRGMLGKIMDGVKGISNTVSKMYTSRIRNKHPVRRLVHEFERTAYKHKIGRRRSETISEWFKRIEIQVDVDIYQKVRYGKMDVTELEVKQLKLELERFQDQFKVGS